MSNKLVKRWEYTTNKVRNSFLIKYFELSDGELDENDYFWVGDEVGGICNFGDYYINFSDMVFCISNNVPVAKFFEWYDWCLETQEFIQLKYFLTSPADTKAIEEKHLAELKVKVKEAEEELKEALKKYGSNNKE